LKSIDDEDLISKPDELTPTSLARLREMYKEFPETWGKLPHEPSRVVLLFM
jgi:hypothetical protein